MDSAAALLDSVQRKLKGSEELSAIVGTRVYGGFRQKPTYPYVFISCSSEPFDTDESTGMEHRLRVQGYAAENKPGTALAIRKAVYAALNRQELSLALADGSLVLLEHEGVADCFPEPGGETYQSIIEFKALVD